MLFRSLQPYEMMTRHVRSTVARRREFTIRHCAQVLRRFSSRLRGKAGRHALAQVLVVASAFAFTEEDVEALVHVDSEELVHVPHRGGQDGEADGFGDAARA